MIVQCLACDMYYDDEFRNTVCTHEVFLANDGQNNFRHYEESWFATQVPQQFVNPMTPGVMSEAEKYEEFLNANKVKT